jgi:signal transduction histidine kinase
VAADERSGLPSGPVRALRVDGDGTIWIGTYDGGLSRLRDGHLATITTHQGLFDNGVFAIVDDGEFFWMSSNRGVYRVSHRELNAVADGQISGVSSLAITRNDGLLSTECNGGMQPVAARTADGRLWFATQKGIASIDPHITPVRLPPPLPIITAIDVDGEQRSANSEVRVGTTSKRVEFRFVAPTMTDSEAIRYRYRLDGFDNRWSDNGSARSVAYTSIPPGRYRFVVSASRAAGAWSPPAASTALVVLPPFWRTRWFIAINIVAAAILIGVLDHLRIRTIRQKEKAHAEFSRRVLIEQEAERKRVATELHDSLGQNLLVIKNRALLGMDENGEVTAGEQLAEISSTATAALEEVRRIVHKLRPVELDHLGLGRSLEMLLRRMTSSSSVLFSGDLESIDGLLTKEAEMNVYRIAQEWLSNVARHSGAQAAVVSLRREQNKLRLRIRDDGGGFSRAQASRDGRHGIGLRSIAERVEMLGGRYDIQSKPGEGTSMTIEFPVREENA